MWRSVAGDGVVRRSVASMATAVSNAAVAPAGRRGRLATIGGLIGSTLARAWRDRVLGLAAEAGFWQLLSLPSLLLAVIGLLGYFSSALGPDTLHDVENAIVHGLKHVIVPSAVDSTVQPAVDRILKGGRADVVSIGFIVSFWTGSSAMATFVNTITIAYGFRPHPRAGRRPLLPPGVLPRFLGVGVVLLPPPGLRPPPLP